MNLPRRPPSLDDHDFLLRTARPLSRVRGERMFDDLTLSVTELLDCDIGLLGLYTHVDGVPSIRTLSCFAGGRRLPEETYALAGTPCETVVGQEFRIFPRDVGFAFPDVTEKNRHISGYAAYPLFDRARAPLGILVVMRYSPIEDAGRAEFLLRVFAERAAAEIERANVADALRNSEEQYRAIFTASVDGLVLIRPDGHVVDVNPALERLYGYTRRELLGNSAYDYLVPEQRELALAFVREVVGAGYAQVLSRARNKAGRMFYVDLRAIRMDYQGAPHVLAILRDVTAARQREQALVLSENRLRATVQSALDCIVSTDERGSILDFNPTAEACFGHRRETVLGRDLLSLIVPEHGRAALTSALEHHLADDAGARRELVAMRADGSEFPAEFATAVAQGARGRILVHFIRDLTERRAAEEERRQLENQLRQAQKMEALGQLTGGVAHDFNNILTSVLGYVQLAAERLEGSGDDKLLRYLSRAQRSGERARDLIQQMLTFSRGQRGERRLLQLGAVVDEGLYLLESTLPATVRIERRFARGLPAVLADPVHLDQVLVNLCINARDAMGGNGTLSIELGTYAGNEFVCASCHLAAQGEFVELAVCDDGPGIEPALRERIFEPFFSTKDVGKGSGMGLATVHGIVHEYGGHLLLDAAPGGGARFRVLLPAAVGGAPQVGEGAHAAPPERGQLAGRVLVVDDNFTVGEFLEELLESWGLAVTTIGDGQRARARLAADPSAFDLVILDQTMPGCTGMELAREFLAARPDLPIVLYTGYSETLSEQVVRRAGIRALVAKPLDLPRFRGLLREILAGG
ncbi:MAG: PAS domain S-box protein [Gammaproteobacteria bacterium]|nr:PAS domain S-box protein [Gammaproteobacteria bacterium]